LPLLKFQPSYQAVTTTYTVLSKNILPIQSPPIGLWTGAAISNTSHSNKAASTTLKRARLTGKGKRSTAVLPQ